MTDDWKPEWVEPRPGFISVPEDSKDEFHERVFAHLQRVHDWGHSSRTIQPFEDMPIRVHELVANTSAGPHSSRLWIANAKGGLFVWTVGSGLPSAVECELWEAAASDALATLGQREPVSWRAFLAQAPAALDHMRVRLDERAELQDGVVLTPVEGVMMTDMMANVMGALAGVHATALIQVDGATPCYSWQADGQAATHRRLRMLSAVVSLAWDTPWFLRDGPFDQVGVAWDGAAGPVSGYNYRWSGDDQAMTPAAAKLPGWVADVEPTLLVDAQHDSAIHRALLMHHEGLLISREHPSLALLAFVASIETIAAMSETLEHCPECNVVQGSTARFKRAAVSVITEDEADRLARTYKQRSRTVHDAYLHGRESLAGGWGQMSLYRPDQALDFEYGTVAIAQKASRALLWRTLDIDSSPTHPLGPS
jgi:hypothetical protein